MEPVEAEFTAAGTILNKRVQVFKFDKMKLGEYGDSSN